MFVRRLPEKIKLMAEDHSSTVPELCRVTSADFQYDHKGAGVMEMAAKIRE